MSIIYGAFVVALALIMLYVAGWIGVLLAGGIWKLLVKFKN